MPIPNLDGQRTGTIAATILGSVLVLTFILATLPFGLQKTGEVANEFDTFQAAQPAVALPDPVAWWKLDETSGTVAADSSGNGHSGTIVGATLGQPGQRGTSFQFPGTSGTGYVLIADSAAFTSASITVSAWAKPLAYNDANPRIYDALRDGPTSSTAILGLMSDTTTKLYGEVSNNLAASQLTGPTPAALNQWVMVTMTYDDASAAQCFYLDSVQEACFIITTPDFNPTQVFIGNRLGGPNNRPWQGYLDDIRHYDVALTPLQIQELYEPGSTAVPSGSAHSSVSAFTLPVVLVLLTSMVFVGLSYFRSRGP